MSMQEFYTNIASENAASQEMLALAQVAQAELEQVQAVRSELAWDPWK